MRPLAAALAVTLLWLGPIRGAAADASERPPDAAAAPAQRIGDPTSEFAERDPNAFDKAFDLFFLRPFGVVQMVGSGVFLVIAYPVALALDGEDELLRACITDPAYQTFERPLGRLSRRPDDPPESGE